MATNVDAPSGFKPVRYLNGSAYDGKHNYYLVPSSNGTATFVGDAVIALATGGPAGTRVSGVDCSGMPTAIRATAGATNVVGVVVGFLPDPTNLSLKYRLASTDRIALVADAPDLIFEVQDDGTLGVDAVGANADLIATAGSTVTGMSAMEVQASSVTAATAQLRLLRPVPREDNDVTTANAKWEVMINEHAYKTTAGT